MAQANGGAKCNSDSPKANIAYEAKFKEMQKYIPFLEGMIKKLRHAKDGGREGQLEKMKSLYVLLSDPKHSSLRFRLTLPTLEKCDKLLRNLYQKVEGENMVLSRLPSIDNGNKAKENEPEESKKTIFKVDKNTMKKKIRSLSDSQNKMESSTDHVSPQDVQSPTETQNKKESSCRSVSPQNVPSPSESQSKMDSSCRQVSPQIVQFNPSEKTVEKTMSVSLQVKPKPKPKPSAKVVSCKISDLKSGKIKTSFPKQKTPSLIPKTDKSRIGDQEQLKVITSVASNSIDSSADNQSLTQQSSKKSLMNPSETAKPDKCAENPVVSYTKLSVVTPSVDSSPVNTSVHSKSNKSAVNPSEITKSKTSAENSVVSKSNPSAVTPSPIPLSSTNSLNSLPMDTSVHSKSNKSSVNPSEITKSKTSTEISVVSKSKSSTAVTTAIPLSSTISSNSSPVISSVNSKSSKSSENSHSASKSKTSCAATQFSSTKSSSNSPSNHSSTSKLNKTAASNVSSSSKSKGLLVSPSVTKLSSTAKSSNSLHTASKSKTSATVSPSMTQLTTTTNSSNPMPQTTEHSTTKKYHASVNPSVTKNSSSAPVLHSSTIQSHVGRETEDEAALASRPSTSSKSAEATKGCTAQFKPEVTNENKDSTSKAFELKANDASILIASSSSAIQDLEQSTLVKLNEDITLSSPSGNELERSVRPTPDSSPNNNEEKNRSLSISPSLTKDPRLARSKHFLMKTVLNERRKQPITLLQENVAKRAEPSQSLRAKLAEEITAVHKVGASVGGALRCLSKNISTIEQNRMASLKPGTIIDLMDQELPKTNKKSAKKIEESFIYLSHNQNVKANPPLNSNTLNFANLSKEELEKLVVKNIHNLPAVPQETKEILERLSSNTSECDHKIPVPDTSNYPGNLYNSAIPDASNYPGNAYNSANDGRPIEIIPNSRVNEHYNKIETPVGNYSCWETPSLNTIAASPQYNIQSPSPNYSQSWEPGFLSEGRNNYYYNRHISMSPYCERTQSDSTPNYGLKYSSRDPRRRLPAKVETSSTPETDHWQDRSPYPSHRDYSPASARGNDPTWCQPSNVPDSTPVNSRSNPISPFARSSDARLSPDRSSRWRSRTSSDYPSERRFSDPRLRSTSERRNPDSKEKRYSDYFAQSSVSDYDQYDRARSKSGHSSYDRSHSSYSGRKSSGRSELIHIKTDPERISRNDNRHNKRRDSFNSPLNQLYSESRGPVTGRGYGKQTYRIPKLKSKESVQPSKNKIIEKTVSEKNYEDLVGETNESVQPSENNDEECVGKSKEILQPSENEAIEKTVSENNEERIGESEESVQLSKNKIIEKITSEKNDKERIGESESTEQNLPASTDSVTNKSTETSNTNEKIIPSNETVVNNCEAHSNEEDSGFQGFKEAKFTKSSDCKRSLELLGEKNPLSTISNDEGKIIPNGDSTFSEDNHKSDNKCMKEQENGLHFSESPSVGKEESKVDAPIDKLKVDVTLPNDEKAQGSDIDPQKPYTNVGSNENLSSTMVVPNLMSSETPELPCVIHENTKSDPNDIKKDNISIRNNDREICVSDINLEISQSLKSALIQQIPTSVIENENSILVPEKSENSDEEKTQKIESVDDIPNKSNHEQSLQIPTNDQTCKTTIEQVDQQIDFLGSSKCLDNIEESSKKEVDVVPKAVVETENFKDQNCNSGEICDPESNELSNSNDGLTTRTEEKTTKVMQEIMEVLLKKSLQPEESQKLLSKLTGKFNSEKLKKIQEILELSSDEEEKNDGTVQKHDESEHETDAKLVVPQCVSLENSNSDISFKSSDGDLKGIIDSTTQSMIDTGEQPSTNLKRNRKRKGVRRNSRKCAQQTLLKDTKHEITESTKEHDKSKKNKKSELDLLHDGLREMFPSKEIENTSVIRSCRLRNLNPPTSNKLEKAPDTSNNNNKKLQRVKSDSKMEMKTQVTDIDDSDAGENEDEMESHAVSTRSKNGELEDSKDVISTDLLSGKACDDTSASSLTIKDGQTIIGSVEDNKKDLLHTKEDNVSDDHNTSTKVNASKNREENNSIDKKDGGEQRNLDDKSIQSDLKISSKSTAVVLMQKGNALLKECRVKIPNYLSFPSGNVGESKSRKNPVKESSGTASCDNSLVQNEATIQPSNPPPKTPKGNCKRKYTKAKRNVKQDSIKDQTENNVIVEKEPLIPSQNSNSESIEPTIKPETVEPICVDAIPSLSNIVKESDINADSSNQNSDIKPEVETFQRSNEKRIHNEHSEFPNIFKDKTYYQDEQRKQIECKICTFYGKTIVRHYVHEHSDQDVLISRLEPSKGEEAILKSKITYENLKPSSYKCYMCSRFCTNFNSFYDHITSHTGEYRYQCQLCQFIAANRDAIRSHFDSSHGAEGKHRYRYTTNYTINAASDLKNVFGFICSACYFVQLKQTTVEEHVKNHHSDSDDTRVIRINMSSAESSTSNRTGKEPLQENEETMNIRNDSNVREQDNSQETDGNENVSAFSCVQLINDVSEKRSIMKEAFQNIGETIFNHNEDSVSSFFDKMTQMSNLWEQRNKILPPENENIDVERQEEGSLLGKQDETANVLMTVDVAEPEALDNSCSSHHDNVALDRTSNSNPESEAAQLPQSLLPEDVSLPTENSVQSEESPNQDKRLSKIINLLNKCYTFVEDGEEDQSNTISDYDSDDFEIEDGLNNDLDFLNILTDFNYGPDVPSMVSVGPVTITRSSNTAIFSCNLQSCDFSCSNPKYFVCHFGSHMDITEKMTCSCCDETFKPLPLDPIGLLKGLIKHGLEHITPEHDSAATCQDDAGTSGQSEMQEQPRIGLIRVRRLSGDKLSSYPREEPALQVQGQSNIPGEDTTNDNAFQNWALRIESVVSVADCDAETLQTLNNLHNENDGNNQAQEKNSSKSQIVNPIPNLPSLLKIEWKEQVAQSAQAGCSTAAAKRTSSEQPEMEPASKKVASGSRRDLLFKYHADFYKCARKDCYFSTPSVSFESRYLLLNHLEDAHDHSANKCAYCFFSTESTKMLIGHMIQAHGASAYSCAYCVYRAQSVSNVLQHLALLHGNYQPRVYFCYESYMYPFPFRPPTSKFVHLFGCPYVGCSFNTYAYYAFIRHLENHRVGKMKCRNCRKPFYSSSVFVHHLLLEHKQSLYQCLYCLHGSLTDHVMKSHLCMMHPNQEPQALIRVAQGSDEKEMAETAEMKSSIETPLSNMKLVDFSNTRLPEGGILIAVSNSANKSRSTNGYESKEPSEIITISDSEGDISDSETGPLNETPLFEVGKIYSCFLCNYSNIDCRLVESHVSNEHRVSKTKTISMKSETGDAVSFYVICSDDMVIPSSKDKTWLETKTKFTKDEIDLLPKKAILKEPIYCDHCEFSNVVVKNMRLHLRNHASGKEVSNKLLVNPVPCLEKKEKMFDKMVNLAGSSHSQPVKTLEWPDFVPPKFVHLHKRYVCSDPGCKYFTLQDTMLMQHVKTLHGEVFRCPHCPNLEIATDKIVQHMRLHDNRLYRCAYCTHHHNQKHVIDKHVADKHRDKTPFVHVIREPINGDKSTSDDVTEETSISNTNSVTDSKVWQCYICGVSKTREADIRNHCLKDHKFISHYKCCFCEFETDVGEFVRAHGDSHTGNEPHIISIYGQVYTKKDDVSTKSTTGLARRQQKNRATHIRGILLDSVQPSKPGTPKKDRVDYSYLGIPHGTYFACPACKIEFKTEGEFMPHLQYHCQSKIWECEICHKGEMKKSELIKHMAKTHPTRDSETAKRVNTIETWVKNVVSHQSARISELSTPVASTSETRPIVNRLQKRSFGNVATIEFDWDGNAPPQKKKRVSCRRYRCPHCSYTSIEEKVMGYHIVTQHIDRTGSSNVGDSNQESTNNEDMEQESSNAGDMKQQSNAIYECQICGVLDTYRALSKHHAQTHPTSEMMITLLEGDVYECNYCGTRDMFSERLHLHSQSAHPNFEPSITPLRQSKSETIQGPAEIVYNCTMCTETFGTSDILNDHLRTHLGYECENCKQLFNGDLACRMHIQTSPACQGFKVQASFRKHTVPTSTTSSSTASKPTARKSTSGNGRRGNAAKSGGNVQPTVILNDIRHSFPDDISSSKN